mgnify:FL=1
MLDEKYFQRYVDACHGNRYQAVRCIASLARSLVKQYDNRILDSEALSWILTGERPDIIDDDGNLKPHKSTISYMDDILSSVDDDEVVDAVKCSISESKKQENLVYLYNNISDSSRQTRVRVLVRIIWYHTHEYK